ncbi:MAG: Crp/Fnr family transcriptional regulator [Bacteroidota bacterium]
MENILSAPLCREVNIATQPVFVSCNHEARAILAAASQSIIRTKGEYFFRENDLVRGLFCLTSGLVKIMRYHGEHAHIVGFLKPGDILGIDCVMMQSPAHSSSASAMTDTGGYFIAREDFLKAVAADPMMNIRLMKSVCEQIERLEEHFSDIKNKSLPLRLAEILLMITGETHQKFPIVLDLKADELANYIHSSALLVKKTLQDFERKRILSLSENAIIINDPELLKKAFQYESGKNSLKEVRKAG